MPRRGYDYGTNLPGPVRSHSPVPGQRRSFEDYLYRSNPRTLVDDITDFAGAGTSTTVTVPVTDNVSSAGTNLLPATNTQTAIATLIAPVSGVITAVTLLTPTGQAANDTNFFTFTMLNKLGAGAGSAAVLVATPSNTTKVTGTGAAALVANIPYSLNLSATAASLRVTAGDVLQFTSTTAGTTTAQDNPMLSVTFSSPQNGVFSTQVTRTAGSPLVQQVANTRNGEVAYQLSASNEVNFAGLTQGDQLTMPATMGGMLQAYLSVGTITTAQSIVVGFATAYNSTLASTSKYAWFRLNASLVLVLEGKDGTTTTTGQATVPSTTLTASTKYLFTVDMRDTASIKFWVDDGYIGALNLSAFAVTDLLQPIVGIHKASGTGTVALNVDFVRTIWSRF